MKNTSSKSSVLLAIFKRKGGEGLFTKIITAENKQNYLNQLAFLKEDEKALLCFKENDWNWLLLTDDKILKEEAGVRISIPFSELTEVNLALKEEFENGIVNKECFTCLELRDLKGNRYIISLEKGNPFQGIFQILHYIASVNKN